MFFDANIPPIPVTFPNKKDPRPEDLSNMDKERKGFEETFDTESATFMDDEQVIAKKRTDYSPDQVGCGAKFHPELTPEEAASGHCAPGVEAKPYRLTNEEAGRQEAAEAELADDRARALAADAAYDDLLYANADFTDPFAESAAMMGATVYAEEQAEAALNAARAEKQRAQDLSHAAYSSGNTTQSDVAADASVTTYRAAGTGQAQERNIRTEPMDTTNSKATMADEADIADIRDDSDSYDDAVLRETAAEEDPYTDDPIVMEYDEIDIVDEPITIDSKYADTLANEPRSATGGPVSQANSACNCATGTEPEFEKVEDKMPDANMGVDGTLVE